MQLTKDINPNIFREYDLRGVSDIDLNEDVAYTLGKAYGTHIQNAGHKKALVGYDNRFSSPSLASALIKGITETGVSVINQGLVTTPMHYFGRKFYGIPTGVMVTASHNPKDDNGFKMAFTKIGNAYGEDILKFKELTFSQNFIQGMGNVKNGDIKKEYLENIKKSIDLGERKVKVVIDCGNGTGSIIVKDILDMFNIDYELLYCDSDPSFPNHIADPSVLKNMLDLGKKVKEVKADFGIGIDGDADRVGAVDENGNFIPVDLLMLIVYRNIVNNMTNKKALFDVKCSRALIEGLNKLNIEPIMYRTGASYCNMMMQKGDFDFGGEYSGHIYFRDKYSGFDDGIYSGLRLIEILSKTNKKFSELLEGVNKYYSTDELKFTVTDNNKFEIVNGIKEYCLKNNYQIIDIDGVRIEFKNSWALIRASNTGPNLSVRFEADNKEELDKIIKEFTDEINKQIEMHS